MDRTDLITRRTLNERLAAHEPPCISIYMPTSRHHPQITGNPIGFRNLLKRAEDRLREQLVTRDVRPLMEPLGAGVRSFCIAVSRAGSMLFGWGSMPLARASLVLGLTSMPFVWGTMPFYKGIDAIGKGIDAFGFGNDAFGVSIDAFSQGNDA